MRIVIPCGASKRSRACAARDMYVGGYFKACRDWALSIAPVSDVFILSAKYGFMPMDRVIEPYNIRFGYKGQITRAGVMASASALGLNGPTIVLGGKDYFSRAKQALPQAVSLMNKIRAECPGGGMGYQIQWLKNNQGRNPFGVPRHD